VIENGAVDEAATASLRARLAAARGPLKAFDFGPERDAWEAVFDDASMTRLNALLMTLGANVRSQRRREIYERVAPGLPRVGAIEMPAAIGDIPAARARLEEEIARLSRDLAALSR
jgi:N-methylhydantoinase B